MKLTIHILDTLICSACDDVTLDSANPTVVLTESREHDSPAIAEPKRDAPIRLVTAPRLHDDFISIVEILHP
jgi:hypothetical protein